jgi:two-component system, OmpR family, sensor histidine kinase CiaH
MKNIFKQSEVSGTNSKPDNFRAAVIRLTIYYSLGVFIILALFSMLVYGLFVESIDDDIREDESRIEMEEVFHSEAKENLFNILLISDAVLILISILISYLLSKRTLAPLEVAYRKQKRFVADAAHELRTPLAVMKAGSEVISQKERSLLEYQQFVMESKEEIERLIKLSNDLLFLANSEKITKDDFAPLSFSDTCKKQCESILPYAKLKQVEVSSNITEGISIQGHKGDVARLVLNLLKNAVDYNKAGGTVFVTLSKKEDKALLSVKDTGIGISDNNLPFIFDRFYKADTSRMQSASSGSGLGLAIVKDIFTRHNGTIKVASVVDQGSVFEVEIPFI